jgi:hypothetical protein
MDSMGLLWPNRKTVRTLYLLDQERGKMNKHLDHRHESLLESLLTGGLPRDVRWNDAVELIGKLGNVEPHGGDEFAFVVGSQRAFFKRPSSHSLEVGEISRLRKFLRDAGLDAAPGNPAQAAPTAVVIDHHLARVYHGKAGSRVESEDDARPYDPHGFHRHLIHRKEAHYQGERVPEDHSFYEEVAHDLIAANEIVLIGDGTGKSSALDFLVEYLKKHHPTIYQRVIATVRKDFSALTEPELEAIAREYI